MNGTVQGHEVVAAVHAEVLDLVDGGDEMGVALAVEAAVARREPLLGPAARGSLVQAVLSRISGMGSLEALFADGSVTEVMVNGPGIVFVERHGRLEATDVRIDAVELDRLVERMVAPTGRRVDRSSPWADGRLPDGSRVNVVVQPIALDGPYLTVRRFGERRFTIQDLSEPPVAEVLQRVVSDRCNVVVTGATGSGKTTLLGAMASAVRPHERLVTVEDAAELNIDRVHVVRMEARPPNCEGVGEVTVRDLVRNALRMRPDRIVVGEVRGAEAFDMLQALNTGHDGSLSTCHANGPGDALRRLATMVLMASPGLSVEVADALVAGSVDVVVHMVRAGAARRVSEVLEVRPPGSDPPVRALVVGGCVLPAALATGGADGMDGSRWGR